jgi:predicted nucleotidyltransferase
MVSQGIQVAPDVLKDFCQRWKIRELAVFGSALRKDFGPGSDVDLLATFAENSRLSLWDMIAAEDEAAQVFGRPVDLVERSSVEQSENWIRRDRILSTARTIYGN